MEKSIEITVIPTRKLFYAEENSFGIFACEVKFDERHKVKLNSYGNITIKGIAPSLNMGEEYKAELKEYNDPKFGVGYQIESIKQELPTTPEQQKSFLASLLTANQVHNIYEAFGDQDVIELIRNDQFDYTKVKGMGEKSYLKVKEKIMENIELQEVLAWLSQYGLKYNTISKLVKSYESPLILIEKLETNPYLLTEVKGIGFIKADQIAKQMGYDPEGSHRIDSCIRHIIKEENGTGNSYIKMKDLLVASEDLLRIKRTLIMDRLESDIKGVLIIDNEKVTLSKVFQAEKYVAMKLHALMDSSRQLNIDVDGFLHKYMEENNLQLTDEQQQIFHNFKKSNVNFLIGYAGVGKTFSLTILLDLIDQLKMTYRLLAPTGKASKVMESYTGRPSSTIHRAIGMFESDGEAINPITSDVIFVDESSMCDIFIVAQLLKVIDNPDVRIIFIGDDFQLPSVGVGNFLYDCINSGVFPVAKLTKVFRQSEGGILDVATKVRKGIKFVENDFDGKKQYGKDLLLHCTPQKYLVDGYKHYYKRVLTKYSKDDIMILSPTKKGNLGTSAINKEIQKIANPPSPEKEEYEYGKDTIFRVGDNVMNFENTYKVKDINGMEVDIYNGDMGIITNIDIDAKLIYIDFDSTIVGYKFSDMKKIQHSYAMTIHKSQGSSSKVVIVIMDKAHKFQLNANLIYTGKTRAKEYLLILSQAETINFGIKKVSNQQRNSFLGGLISLNDFESDC